MRLLLFLLIIVSPLSFRAQSRVMVDMSSNFSVFNYSLLYCPVVKEDYYIKTGISVGGYGRGNVERKNSTPANNGFVSPYYVMNLPVDSMVKLVYYTSESKGFALEAGLGRFIELNPWHTIRFDLQSRFYFLKERMFADYDPVPGGSRNFTRNYELRNFCMALGPEIFHAVRFSARFTLSYGIKLPFFIPINTKNHRNQKVDTPTKGFQPLLSFGISCALGKKHPEE